MQIKTLQQHGKFFIQILFLATAACSNSGNLVTAEQDLSLAGMSDASDLSDLSEAPPEESTADVAQETEPSQSAEKSDETAAADSIPEAEQGLVSAITSQDIDTGDVSAASPEESTSDAAQETESSQAAEKSDETVADAISEAEPELVASIEETDGNAEASVVEDATDTAVDDCIAANNEMNITDLIAALPAKESGSTKICFAPGDYRQNIVISGKSNLILQGQGEVNFIEINSDKKTADGAPIRDNVTYFGVPLKISDSKNIVLDHLTLTNKHYYFWGDKNGNELHQVARALEVNGSSDIVVKNSHISASGKQAVIAASSTLNIFDSELKGYYFVVTASEGGTIYTENSTFTHIPGDGHAFFWVFYGDLYFKNCTFVNEENGAFLAGYNDPIRNRVIVENPTVINSGKSSLNSLVIQHPNYYGLNLYWLGPLPDLWENSEYPKSSYFGTYVFGLYRDPNHGVGPSRYVKVCSSEDSESQVTCNQCETPEHTYAEVLTTQAEYDAYRTKSCKQSVEPSPTYSDVNSRRCYQRDSDGVMHLLPSCP